MENPNFEITIDSPERALWFAVLEQVSEDLLKFRMDAINWFYESEFAGDRKAIFALTGVDEAQWRKALENIIFQRNEKP